MFTGESAITIDDKGRMALPAAYRESVAAVCGNRLVVTYNPYERECLWIFPYPEWERVRDEVMALKGSRQVHRDLQRKLVGSATPLELDGSGRVLLPASLRTNTGMNKNAVLLGMGNKFELWTEAAQRARLELPISEAEFTPEMENLSF